MRYDMEELLEKAYSQKEKPTEEFCQSVVCKMKEKEAKTSFWGVGWLENRVLIAAACIGILLLAGTTLKVWMIQNGSDHRPSLGQFAAEVQTPAPTATNSIKDTDALLPGDTPPGQDDLQQDGQGEYGNYEHGVPGDKSGNPSDASTARARAIPVNQEGKITNTGHPGKPNPGMTPSGYPIPRPSYAPEFPSGSETEAPPARQTQPPQKTEQPMLPMATPGEYVSLCSIDTLSFDYTTSADDGEICDSMALPVCSQEPLSDNIAHAGNIGHAEGIGEWGDLFKNRIISSYSDHQVLLKEVRKELTERPLDTELQDMVQQLERYDEDFFRSNVLCINMFFLERAYQLRLSSVNIRERGPESLELHILTNKILLEDTTDETLKGMKCYGCFVRVSKIVARNCKFLSIE